MPQVSAAQFRAFALDASSAQKPASMLVARVPSGKLPVGLTRDDAREYFESTLFTGAVCTLSVPRGSDLAEVLAVVHQAFGPEVPAMLRAIAPLSPNLDYYYLLTDGARFVRPTLLQDAYLAREFSARAPVPA